MLAEGTRDDVFEMSVRGQLDAVEAALLEAAQAGTPMVTDAAHSVSRELGHGGG